MFRQMVLVTLFLNTFAGKPQRSLFNLLEAEKDSNDGSMSASKYRFCKSNHLGHFKVPTGKHYRIDIFITKTVST